MKKNNIYLIILFILAFIISFYLTGLIRDKFQELKSTCATEVQRYTYMPDGTYLKLDKLLKSSAWTSKYFYDEETYNCVGLSEDLKEELEEIGIRTELITGKHNGKGHMWIGIWIEPQTGEFINIEANYKRK